MGNFANSYKKTNHQHGRFLDHLSIQQSHLKTIRLKNLLRHFQEFEKVYR